MKTLLLPLLIVGVATGLVLLGMDMAHTTWDDGEIKLKVHVMAPAVVRGSEFRCQSTEADAIGTRDFLLATGFMEIPKPGGANPCVVTVPTTHKYSGFGWTINDQFQQQFGVMHVELDNDERWAVLLTLPDVRTVREITCRIPGPDAQRITAPKPKIVRGN